MLPSPSMSTCLDRDSFSITIFASPFCSFVSTCFSRRNGLVDLFRFDLGGTGVPIGTQGSSGTDDLTFLALGFGAGKMTETSPSRARRRPGLVLSLSIRGPFARAFEGTETVFFDLVVTTCTLPLRFLSVDVLGTTLVRGHRVPSKAQAPVAGSSPCYRARAPRLAPGRTGLVGPVSSYYNSRHEYLGGRERGVG